MTIWRGRDFLLGLNAFNQGTERARRGYHEMPDACAQEAGSTCSRCTDGKHHTCSGKAFFLGRRVECACARDDHATH